MSAADVYTIIISNGERLILASDLRLSIALLGTQPNLSAGPFSLRSKGTLFERHHGDETEVYSGYDATKDIGDIYAIRLEAKSGWRVTLTPIYINYIRVRQPSRGQDCFFPVYSWIQPDTSRLFFCGPGRLPNDQRLSPYMRQLRGSDLAYWQRIYDSCQMQRLPNLPVGMSCRYLDLPADEQFLSVKARQIFLAILTDIADTALARISANTKTWESFDAMKLIFYKNGRLLTPIADVWEQDATVGRGYVSGLSPNLIKLCEGSFPEGFPITIDDIQENVSLFRRRDIHDDLRTGRFCYLDFRPMLEDFVELQNQYRRGFKVRPKSPSGFLQNILSYMLGTDEESYDNRYMAAPVCIFHYDDRIKCIAPVAIQLKRNGNIYYPVDESYPEEIQNEWLLAKMWLNSANVQVHQLQGHFFRCHMVVECFAIALRRSMSPAHPLYRLLKPHLQNVMAMNSLARQRLLPLICKMLALGQETMPFLEKSFSLWSYDHMSPKKELKSNGFGPSAKTPLVNEEGAYPWREDVILIWDAIKAYVKEYVAIYYSDKDDGQVAGDNELSHFRLELQDLMPGHTFPEFRTVKDIVSMASRVIYQASAGHSAINFNQYEHYAWQPLNPALMRKPIPDEIDEPITGQVILESIPNMTQTIQGVAVARALSEYSPDEVYLGRWTEQDLLHSDPKARAVFDQFSQRLDEVAAKIKERNATSRKDNPYTYLLPSMITSSVAI